MADTQSVPRRAGAWTHAVKALVSVALIAWLLRENPVSLADFAAVRSGPLAFAFIVLALQPVLGGMRWMIVAGPLGGRFAPRRAIVVTLIAAFLNHILPASVGGDAYRLWAATRVGMPWRTALGGVVLDRIVALIVLLLMIGALWPWTRTLVDDPRMRGTLACLALAGVAGVVILLTAEPLLRCGRDYRLVRLMAHPSALARQAFGTWFVAGSGVALSLIVHVSTCAAAWAVASAYAVDLSFLQALVLMPLVILAYSLPISMGGWGVREAAFVAALGVVGVPSGVAMAAALMLGCLMTLAGLPGLFFWLFERRQSPL